MALALLAVAACSGGDDDQRGRIGYVTGFLGGVAADEPRAALVGRDVLSAGGSAADAAVAVAFALSVTLPSSAGLGAGGVCVTYHSGNNEAWALDFRSANGTAAAGQRPVAVPGLPRGMFALHSKYGRLHWAQVLAPAENIARFGEPISRALARDLSRAAGRVTGTPDLRALFTRPGGREVVGESELLVQLELAGTLGQLRGRGPGDLYSGRLGRQVVDAVAAAGGGLTMEDMRNFSPRWVQPLTVKAGNENVYFPPAPVMGGNAAAQMFAYFEDSDRYEDASDEARLHVLAETAARAWSLGTADAGGRERKGAREVRVEPLERLMASYRADRHTPVDGAPGLPAGGASTGFVVVDRDASAVACTLTMNAPFGAGRVAEGSGIILAAPTQEPAASAGLAPALVVNRNVQEFFFGAAPSGGAQGTTALVEVLARMTLMKQAARDAQLAPRAHNGGSPDVTRTEQDTGLGARGHRVEVVPALGLVNVVACPDGIPPDPDTCQSLADPRGAGLAASAD
ncbi:MAG: gamma-glutamyltransferase [Hyphomicrobiales bacterium]|nr:gamma-glutamyltransferase [Hyphomicrobiales bacterium]